MIVLIGPDCYATQDWIGRKTSVAKMKNSPSFGFLRGKNRNDRVVVSPTHRVDVLGVDSPPVGLYDVNLQKIFKT